MTLNLPNEIPDNAEGLKSYLYNLVEQLQYVLNNIGEENLTTDLMEQITDEGGILNADRIRSGRIVSTDGSTVVDLDRDTITLSRQRTYYKTDYSQTDLDRLQGIILGTITPTTEDYNKYDWYDEGELSVTNLLAIQKLIQDNEGDYVTVYWKTELSSNRESPISFEWGKDAESDEGSHIHNRTFEIKNGEQVVCLPKDVSESFSIASYSGVSSCSIEGAYYSAGYCTVRVSLVNSAIVANGDEYSATITFPSGCTPLIVSNSSGYYGGRSISGRLNTAGRVTFKNCGESMAANHTVNMTFTYPCS